MMWGNKKLAGPEENLIAKLMDTDVWRTSKWIRVSVEQEFGRWCHPTKRSDGGSDFGMCESYRWAVGIEGHRPGTQSHLPPPCRIRVPLVELGSLATGDHSSPRGSPQRKCAAAAAAASAMV